ncbi:Universal stress protein family protein [Chitinophaga sp. CF118]|uniref:universal stress protein n=1 Tax=Chitinophaga sp. CF118 TaxID=1884367 RepID=UPI0008E4224B|nr:universal stress protein [Chitinophaga sp. CF118]SFE00117.1 Universal stress protein family protein [Chitinophaga sp. CF118]
MEKLIVAVDFPITSENVAHYTADLALQMNDEILLLHVIDITLVVPGIMVTDGYYITLEDDPEYELIDEERLN